MMNSKLVGIGGAALLAAMLLHAPAAQAQKVYQVYFTRAYDECTSMTVMTPGSVNNCPAAHVTTNPPNLGWSKAKFKMSVSNSKGTKLALTGKGFLTPAPTKIGLQLTLRVTNQANLFAPGMDTTYQDETIICGTTSGGMCGQYFAPDTDGKIKGSSSKMLLSQCVTDNGFSGQSVTQLSTGNIEVVDAALVDCDTGKVFGTPGVVQPPTP
jgi:hypothetical protein